MGSVPDKIKVTDISRDITIGNKAKGYDVFSIHQNTYLGKRFLYYTYPAKWILGIRYWPAADEIELIKLTFTREAAISLFTVKKTEIVELLDKEYPQWRKSFDEKPLYFDVRRRKVPSALDFTISFPPLKDNDDSIMFVKCEDNSYNPDLDTLYGVWSRGNTDNTSVSILFLYKIYFSQYFCLPSGASPRVLGKAASLSTTEKFFMNMGYPQVQVDKTDGLPELYSDLKEPRDDFRRKTPRLDEIATTITTSQLFLPKSKDSNKKNVSSDGAVVYDKSDGIFLSELIELGIDDMLQAIKTGETLDVEVDIMQDDIELVRLTDKGIKIKQRRNSVLKYDEFKSIFDTDNLILEKPETSKDDEEDDSEAYMDYMSGMGYRQLDG